MELARGHPSHALRHLRRVEAVLAADIGEPGAIIAALRTAGRSPGATTRLVAEFFERAGLGCHLDETARLAVERRARRLERFPARLRPGAAAFADHLVRGRERASLFGRHGISDRTIDIRLGDLAILARHLADRGIADWAAVSTADLEAYLNTRRPGSRLPTLRGFFAFAGSHRLVLVNPTKGLSRRRPHGFAGRVLTLAEQRTLLDRWTGSEAPPLERTVGLLCLLHGASSGELRHLRLDAVDLDAGTLRLGRRRHPLPPDPVTADAVSALLSERQSRLTVNPHPGFRSWSVNVYL